jgi:thiol-disulfide isomerase/thioredoxin
VYRSAIELIGTRFGDSASGLRREVTKYSMIGQPAAPLLAQHWINAPAGRPERVDLEGKVTLVEFTTNWCGWCEKGYPAINKLDDKYRKKGLQVVFLTYLEGTAGGVEMTREEELAYNRKHWVEGFGIDFTIGVVETEADPEGSRRKDPYFFESYGANGFPTYVFIDRRGIVRYIQSGHRNDLEAKFTKLIEELLAEEPDATR